MASDYALVNIGGLSNDASHRYKMPALKSKFESSGNGVKTCIINSIDLCKALNVPPLYLTKFMGYELAAQANFDKEREYIVIMGQHDQKVLVKNLDSFIKQFVLCPNCKLPECVIEVSKNQVMIDCSACGFNGLMNYNKLTNFILKNAPKSKKKAEKDQQKKDLKKQMKLAKSKSSEEETVEVSKTQKQPIQWHVDNSIEAIELRKQQTMKELGVNLDEYRESKKQEKELRMKEKNETPEIVFSRYIQENTNPTLEQLSSEIKRIQIARTLDEYAIRKVMVIGTLNCDDVKTIGRQVKKYSFLYRHFAKDETEQENFINIFEEIFKDYPFLITKIQVIFKNLFDENVISEKVFIDWHNTPALASYYISEELAKTLRNQTVDFINWLQEESDDDEEEEEKE